MYYLSPQEVRDTNIAFEAAEKATHRCRHGAVVRRGSRVTVGYNKVKNNPKHVEDQVAACSTHAEVDALRQHSNPRNARVVSVRLDKAGKAALARPCFSCRLALVAAGVRRVVFSSPDSPSGFELMVLR